MDSLQRKGLEQAIKLLDSMSSYDGYKFLSEICKDAEEKEEVLKTTKVLAVYNENTSRELGKAREAISWIKAVLEKENQK